MTASRQPAAASPAGVRSTRNGRQDAASPGATLPARRAAASAPRARVERAITPELVRQALAAIPPDLAHDERVRVFAAVFDGIGDAGEDLVLDWAGQRAKADAAGDRASWRSVRKPGKVKVGTLFYVARQHGFKLPKAAGQAATVDPAAAAAAAAARAAREAELEAEYRAHADGAAKAAARMWNGASATGSSPYLERKGVQAHGVRFLKDGTLLVPLRNGAGELMNLQRIAPRKPEGGAPEKLYFKGGRKAGLWHWIGEPAGAPVLLLAEGYATAATLHEATGRPVAVCFDSGNVATVAKAVRELFPGALIVACGDDDQATEQRTGKNPGRLAAAAAARAVASEAARAGAVFPEGLPEGGTDFNDLAAAAGLERVRELVERAIADPQVPGPRRGAKSGRGDAIDGADVSEATPAGAGGAGGAGGRGGGSDGAPPGGGDAPSGAAEPDRWGFVVDERGVWHVKRDSEGEKRKPQWLCAPLHVTARTRSDDLNGWGYLLEFADPDHNPKSWAMPAALLAGEGSEWAGRLRDMGLRMAPGTAARNLVATYIDTRHPDERVTCVDRVGWHGPVYVLPSGSIGQVEGRRFVFQSESGMDDTFRRHGELADWQREVAALCVGNSRLLFAVCAAFAGPVLRPSGLESGGFNFRADSRAGKTTGLLVAASVWGRPSYMQRWRTTDNALEATAAQHCDGLLILDELGQLDPRVAGECAYMLSNEQEKGRATRGGLARRRRTWRLLFLSSGEVGLADLMAEAGKRMRAGQEVRMVDIPLDAGQGMGGIEQLHRFREPAELAEAIAASAARFYGTAGRAWLEWCAGNFHRLPQQLGELVARYRDEFVPEASSGQVRTVGSRCALVAAAGELATAAGITGWPAGEAARGVRRCFEAWLAARGHLDNGEEAAMLAQVRAFLEKNGEALFTWSHRAMDDHKPNTPMRAGFKRLVDDAGRPLRNEAALSYAEGGSVSDPRDREAALVEYLVLPEAWRRDVCRGFDATAVARLLQRRGHLKGQADRLLDKQRLPGMGNAACYRVLPSIFGDSSA